MLNVVIFIRWTSVWLIIPITTHRFQRLGRTLVIILARLVFSATFSSIWINASGTVTALFWGGPKDRTSPTEKTSVATSSSIFLGFFCAKKGLSMDFIGFRPLVLQSLPTSCCGFWWILQVFFASKCRCFDSMDPNPLVESWDRTIFHLGAKRCQYCNAVTLECKFRWEGEWLKLVTVNNVK